MSNQPSKVQRLQDLRRSNAAQPQDSRPKRQRTRAAVKRQALRDSNGG